MKILILSHKDIDEVKKTGTNVRAALIFKYFSLKQEVKYVKKLLKEDIDWCDCIYVIHFQGAYSNFTPLMATKKPIYYELHSFWAHENQNKIVDTEELLVHELKVIERSKVTFCFSSQLRDSYIERGIDKNKLHISIPGFDIEDYEFIVTYVGNFKPWQGIDNLYYCAIELPHISFILIGEVEGECLELSNIECTGYKTGKELQRYMKMSDVLIVPREDIIICQTMGGKFGGYMMYPEKILATNVCDMKKYVNACFPSKKALVSRLSVMYFDKIKKLRESKFNMENIADKILKVIECEKM